MAIPKIDDKVKFIQCAGAAPLDAVVTAADKAGALSLLVKKADGSVQPKERVTQSPDANGRCWTAA